MSLEATNNARDDVCTDVRGATVSHGLAGRHEEQFLWAKPPSSKHLENFTIKSIPSIEPTRTERSRAPGAEKYLWIGLLKMQHDHNPNSSPSILRVVTPVKTVVQTRFYALVNPDIMGICEASVTNLDSVYFFAEFTDKSTSIRAKRKNWAQKISNRIAEAVDEEEDLTTSSMQSITNETDNVIDTNRDVFDTEKLAEDLKFLVSAYLTTGDEFHIDTLIVMRQEMIEAGEEPNEDPESASNKKILLDLLIPSQEEFTDDSVTRSTQAMRAIWPQKTFTTWTVEAIAKAIRSDENIFIPFRHFRPLALILERSSAKIDKSDTANTNKLVAKIVTNLNAVNPERTTATVSKEYTKEELLSAVAKRLDEILMKYEDYTNRAKDRTQDDRAHTKGAGTDDLILKLATKSDPSQILRELEEYNQKMNKESLDDIIQDIEKLRDELDAIMNPQ